MRSFQRSVGIILASAVLALVNVVIAHAQVAEPPVADAGGPYSTSIQRESTYNGSGSTPPAGGTIVSYEWDFGDGGTATGEFPIYSYAEEGNYTITLKVTADNGESDTDEAEVSVANRNLPPVADAGGPYGGSVGNPVAVDASGSSDDAGIVRYDWFWGDGFANSDTGVTTSHTYSTNDIFNANVTVSDAEGLQDTAGTQVTIGATNQPPTASAGGPYGGAPGVAVRFDATGSVDPENSIATYDWTYGDGSQALDAGPTPTHTYDESCVCSVQVIVRDTSGGEGRNYTVAIITEGDPNQRPVADANGPYQGSAFDEAVTFDATGSSDADGDALQYDWNYGDGSAVDVDAGPTPSHVYTGSGVFAASVVVSDGKAFGDDADIALVYIPTVNEPPVADAGGPYNGTTGVAVQFDGTLSDDVDGDVVQYDWDYGDGSALDVDAGPTPSHVYAAAGNFTATLTVTDNDMATDSSQKAVAIDQANEPPVAEVGGPYTGTVGVAVDFDASGSSDDVGVVQYDWDFGDTNTAPNGGPTQSNTYATAGLYRVEVTVTDGGAATDNDVTLVYIAAANAAPEADAGGPYTGTASVAINFDGSASSDDGSIASWEWDFDGDGTVDDTSGATPSFTYTAAGVYLVRLRVTDDDGAVDIDETLALVDQPLQDPVANAGGPYTSGVGLGVVFNGAASTDPDGAIVQYDWDFGDGNTAPAAGPITTHTYVSSGTYEVSLTVTDSDARTNVATTTASIGTGNLAPLVDIDGPYPGLVNLPVKFNGSRTTDPEGGPLTYDWDFGDATPNGTGIAPSHSYASAGVYRVILTVTDSGGLTASDSAAVNIGSGTTSPIADAGATYSGAAGFAITFNGSASTDPDGGRLVYAWSFGDGDIASGPAPTHVYADPGSYDVVLIVTDDTGRQGSATATALVGEPPVADAGGPYTARRTKTLGFDGSGSSDPDGGTLLYAWDFGDGGTASGATPTHVYQTKGTFTVTLTVTDDTGATGVDSTSVEVRGDGGGGGGLFGCSVGEGSANDPTLLLLALLSLLYLNRRRLGL